MEPYFSVIIPVFNGEAYLGEAIESALGQLEVKAEVIVVNDGSTDRSAAVADSFGASVRVVHQENQGISAARNRGAQVASGNVLAFLDADDVWLPGKLKAQSSKLLQGYDLVYSNRFNFGKIGDLPELQSGVVAMAEGDLWEKLLFGNFITTSSVAIGRKLFLEQGGFRKEMRYCEDWDLWLRCAERSPVGYCPEPLVKYRIHSNGLSGNYKLMSAMREEVVSRALAGERGGRLAGALKRRICAGSWSTSGWEAARAKDLGHSLRCYKSALYWWPFDSGRWYDLARVIANRA